MQLVLLASLGMPGVASHRLGAAISAHLSKPVKISSVFKPSVNSARHGLAKGPLPCEAMTHTKCSPGAYAFWSPMITS
jgi:hypothetical protein